MKPPSSFSFALAVGRGASARGRRPSLRRSSWPGRGNRLSRSAATLAQALPSLRPSRESSAPEGRLTRKANP